VNIHHDRLRELSTAIFTAAGCQQAEAARISFYLVEANLAGHDSHGVLRIPSYVDWLRTGKVIANKTIKVLFENDVIAVMDGEFGFGQTVGEQAMKLGIEKSDRHGVAVVALRNSGHLGQIGAWALMAARANRISIHFVNTSGAGILVAPHGGINRRISANPIAAGIPVRNGHPLVLDISTSTIAEGKIRLALNKGVPVPDNCLIDAKGRPTTDPKVFYANPPGAILPFGGHKGYGLAMIAEMLAGALTGSSCSNPSATRVVNGMLTIILSPRFFISEDEFYQEAQRFIDYVKSSEKVSPDGEILMPGELEEKTRQNRIRDGIEVDDTTWNQILATCRALQLSQEYLDTLILKPMSTS
jgi:hydroxycarboxylate dehydrogenase B